MTTSPSIRPSVLDARQRMLEGRDTIRTQHAAGSPGIQICTRLADLLDSVVIDLFESALADLWPSNSEEFRSQVALVAHGGFGRREVAPYSDVDLLVLYAHGADQAVFPLASRLLRDLSDTRLELGQSLCTPEQACQLAAQDATVCTAFMDSRLLAGSAKLFKTFSDRFARQTRSRPGRLYGAIERARRRERTQFGETVYLLEPNIKRSSGGLRDLQLLRWLGFTVHATTDPAALQLKGELSKHDQHTLRDATEFLLRIRNEMHFQAGQLNDVLDRHEQVRIAELYRYQGTEAILPVERFMSEYFRHTSGVRSIVRNVVDAWRPGQAWLDLAGRVFCHYVEHDYRVTFRQIVATRSGTQKLKSNLQEVLKLCQLSNLQNKQIAPATWETVRAAVPRLSDEMTSEISEQFLALLAQPGRLGKLLRRLHEVGALEKIIPAFTHARSLLQFNEYHRYTVDEHCILAVEEATEFIRDTSTLGRVYRGIKQKRILHLALLIHDLGKGFVEDHSEVGLRIAEEVAERLRLPVREAETLKFLVHKHLMMSHLAFWRDYSDPALVLRFAVDVGSPEVLDMLFVLTAADFAAVGPGVWDSWKADVLTGLYKRTMRHLAGDAPASVTLDGLKRRQKQVRELLSDAEDQEWFARQIDALPYGYAIQTPAEQIATELRELHDMDGSGVFAHANYVPKTDLLQFVVGTREAIAPGIFHKLTGALTSHGMQIRSADINTLADGLVLDRFYVNDPDFVDQTPQERIDAICAALVESLTTTSEVKPAFRKIWQTSAERERAALSPLPSRVLIDNSSSDYFTIIDVFAHDRRGLLYTIAQTLFEMDLSLSVAKIGTYLDQVVDVFYVTDQAGRKLTDEARLSQITGRLLEAIDSLET
ncbi:MAG: [protein-PII] uridylyltransferase [Planctomycetota bacterium]|nr:MAG: [protein-PII] uridylyltransferase [Planctomycetota bacterium]